MSAAEREPYERLSTASKALYARLKTLTPEQRATQEGDPSQLQARSPPAYCIPFDGMEMSLRGICISILQDACRSAVAEQ